MLKISYTSGMRNTGYPTPLPEGLIESPSVIVEIETTGTGYAIAGWLCPVFGDIEGKAVRAILGKHLYDFSPPGFPYYLKFRAKPWAFPWNLRIYKDSEQFRPRIVPYTPTPTPTRVLAVRGDRLGASLQNSSGVTIYIGFTQNLSPENAIDKLFPGGQWLLDGKYIGEVWMLSESVAVAVKIVEYTKNPIL